MRASTLSVLFGTLLGLPRASAGLMRTTDAEDAQVSSFSDAVSIPDYAVAPSQAERTNSAAETSFLRRRSDMQIQSLDALANLLTRMPLRADCFFVTSAQLLGTTVHEIANGAGIAVPQPGSGGISISNMVAALERLGLRFRVWTYHDDGEGGPSRTPLGVPESQAYPAVGAPRVMGVAYRRPGGSGHVVIVRSAGKPYRHYIDYQASPRGVDVTRDVLRSRIFAYFAVDLDASSGRVFEQQRETIERMEIDQELIDADEPLNTEEYPGEEPMDVERDVATGGVDLSTLAGDVLQRIRNGLLPQGECAALVALAAVHASRRLEPRVVPGFDADEDKCMRLQEMVPREKPEEHESNVIVHDETR